MAEPSLSPRQYEGSYRGFPGNLVSKESACNAGDTGDSDLISGLGRSPGERDGSPCQYSCLGNSIERGAWQATVHGIARELDTT